MKDGNSKSTSSNGEVKSVAVGVNTLLAVAMRRASQEDDEDVYTACLAAMSSIVKEFEGEEAANDLINAYTNGALSKMSELVKEEPDFVVEAIKEEKNGG